MIGDDSVVTYTSYDAKGNIAAETDALGVVTSYSYGEEGQLAATDIANDGTDITVNYYTLKNGQEQVQVTDANKNTKNELTDANGATLQTEDVGTSETGSIVTTYTYDEKENAAKNMVLIKILLEVVFMLNLGKMIERKGYVTKISYKNGDGKLVIN